jgi:TRAP-type C4-dicarboxylate transport system permease small subunit
MRKVADIIMQGLAGILVAIFSVMMVLVFAQVVVRFIPGYSLFWTEEVVRILLVWTVMLGVPVVLYQRQEILVDLFPYSPRFSPLRFGLASALSGVFLLILWWQGWNFTERLSGSMSPTLGISRGWIYAAIPIGAFLGCIALLIRPAIDPSKDADQPSIPTDSRKS